jgi:hypothetical protein
MQDRITQDTLARVGFQRKPVTAAGGTLKRSRRPDGVGKSAYHHLSQNEIAGDNSCSQQLSEKVRLAQILSGYLRVAVILPQWATANREAKKCLQRPYDVSSANLFHSEPQAHVVLPLQAYRCLYPLEP